MITDDKSFLEYCLSHYKNSYYTHDEFIDDINQIVVIKRLFSRYSKSNKINERLVLNIIITLLNIFDIETVNIILFYKLPSIYYPQIKPFLIHLNSYAPNNVADNIQSDINIIRLLEAM